MPIRPSRSQFLLEVSHLVLAAIVALTALAACGASVLPGHAAAAEKSGIPADHYDAVIWLCPGTPFVAPCSEQATAAQIAALRARLLADRDVVDIVYVSEQKAFELAKQALAPDIIAHSEIGDFPASYTVKLPASFSAQRLDAAYRDQPGVFDVLDCSKQVVCQVAALRRAGVIGR